MTVNAGMKMPSWFDLYHLSSDGPEDTEGIVQATKSGTNMIFIHTFFFPILLFNIFAKLMDCHCAATVRLNMCTSHAIPHMVPTGPGNRKSP